MTAAGRERRLRGRTLYRGRVVTLRVDEVRLPNGRTHIREVVGHRPAVAVVPWLPGGRVLLVCQYRYAVGHRVWELPAGILDRGETPLQAAVRELREETGYRAARLCRLGTIYSSPGYCRERIHLYLAEGLKRVGPPALDEDELLRVSELSWAQAWQRVRRGRVQDGKTVLGLCWAADVLAQRGGGFHIARNPGSRYTNHNRRKFSPPAKI